MALIPRDGFGIPRPVARLAYLAALVAAVALIIYAGSQLLEPVYPSARSTSEDEGSPVSTGNAETPETGFIAEVGSATQLSSSPTYLPPALGDTGAAQHTATSEASSVTVVQPGAATTEGETAAAAAPIAEAPFVPVPATPTGPVERWAATGVILETLGQEWDAVSLANVDAALAALPAGVLADLGNPSLGPMHVLVNSHGRTLSGGQPYGGPANFFSTNDGVNELVLYPQQSTYTVVHELGHAYNLRHVPAGSYALVLLDPEMQSFLAATGWQVLSSESEVRRAVDHMQVRYAYTGSFTWQRVSNDNPLEDFANTFAMYYLDPNGLKSISPERYAWMAANLP